MARKDIIAGTLRPTPTFTLQLKRPKLGQPPSKAEEMDPNSETESERLPGRSGGVRLQGRHPSPERH
eukprot:6832709-Pyramimonas_sp.AAC.1